MDGEDIIDLDAVLALAVDYDGRMQIARDIFDRSEPIPEHLKQYLAPMKDIVVVKAFEALRPLVARVQELEAEADILADRIACHNKGCYCGFDVKYWRQWAREKREANAR